MAWGETTHNGILFRGASSQDLDLFAWAHNAHEAGLHKLSVEVVPQPYLPPDATADSWSQLPVAMRWTTSKNFGNVNGPVVVRYQAPTDFGGQSLRPSATQRLALVIQSRPSTNIHVATHLGLGAMSAFLFCVAVSFGFFR